MKKYIILCLIILFAATGVYAFDWSAQGLRVQDTRQEENETNLVIADEAGTTFGVKYFGTLADDKGSKIIELNKSFRTWKNMKVRNVNFLVSNEIIQIIIVPSEFKYKTVDILKYLPAGMMFTYIESREYKLKYNFRITKDNLLVRVKDDFVDEERLSKNLNEAIKDPLAYIKRRDPDYFLKKLNDLEEKNKKLLEQYNKLRYTILTLHNSGFFSGATAVKKKVLERIIDIKTEDPKLGTDAISKKLEKEKLEASDKEIELILNIYFNEFKK
ncbi:MAG: hypothetical protein GY754_02670 [bacterium]|nr:hypothetical protein [bacterium]